MFKVLLKYIKKIVFSFFLLYGYNIVMQPIGFLIPINIITVGFITLLGVPALLSLIFIMILVF